MFIVNVDQSGRLQQMIHIIPTLLHLQPFKDKGDEPVVLLIPCATLYNSLYFQVF